MPQIRMRAERDNLEALLAFVRECIENSQLPSEPAGRAELAMEEALVNILHHAFPDGGGWLEVHGPEAGATEALFEIHDDGIPFDPLSLPDPDTVSAVQDRKIGGLGVFFMKKMSDGISYHREGTINSLSLRFTEREDPRV